MQLLIFYLAMSHQREAVNQHVQKLPIAHDERSRTFPAETISPPAPAAGMHSPGLSLLPHTRLSCCSCALLSHPRGDTSPGPLLSQPNRPGPCSTPRALMAEGTCQHHTLGPRGPQLSPSLCRLPWQEGSTRWPAFGPEHPQGDRAPGIPQQTEQPRASLLQ